MTYEYYYDPDDGLELEECCVEFLERTKQPCTALRCPTCGRMVGFGPDEEIEVPDMPFPDDIPPPREIVTDDVASDLAFDADRERRFFR